MIKIKQVFIFLFLFLQLSSQCQSLRKSELSKDDKVQGVSEKYEFFSPHIYVAGGLLLYKDGTFYYRVAHSELDIYSKGKWRKVHKRIILNSFRKQDTLPIKLEYITHIDSSKYIYKTKFQVPEDINGKMLDGGMIFINNDSTYCLPGGSDVYHGQFNTIDSIKVDFDGLFKTKWVKVLNIPYINLLIRVKVPFPQDGFWEFKERIYEEKNSLLTLVKE